MTTRVPGRHWPRYLLGGAVCAAAHNAIMIGADAADIAYPVALLLSFSVTTPMGYALHSSFTFEVTWSGPRLRRYLAGAASGFLVSAALMALFCSWLRMPVAIATPIATVLLFLWNFAAARWAILFGRSTRDAVLERAV